MPDPMLLGLGVLAAIWAGISKGGFGSGAAFASGLLLATILDPKVALGIMLPLLMLIDALTMRSYWRGWHGPSAVALILGGLPGVAIGVALVAVANEDALRLLIAAVALGFVAWQLAGHFRLVTVRPAPFRRSVGVGTGVLAGFTSFISHAGGPPVAVFLLSQGLSKTTYQATTVVTFAVINVFKAVPYAGLGFFTAESLMLALWLAPSAALGTWLGIKAHRFVPERQFFALSYVLLTLTGLKLIWDVLN